MSSRPQPFDYQSFRAVIFAAWVARDWEAVTNALALIEAVTGAPVVNEDASPAEVASWARVVCQMLEADGAYLRQHGDAHPRLVCDNPDCATHGRAARARLARRGEPAAKPSAELRATLVGRALPGVH